MKQISIFVENKVGSLAGVTGVLAAKNVNVRAFSVFDSQEFCILRMIVDDVGAAKEILEQEGFAVGVTEVLAVELLDQPGSLDRIIRIIRDKEININYIYSFANLKEGSPYIVFNLNDMGAAREALKTENIKIVE